jgi:DNA-binding MarR family transcriptional regulator
MLLENAMPYGQAADDQSPAPTIQATDPPRRAHEFPRHEFVRVARFRTELRRFLSRTEAASRAAGLTPQRYDLLLMINSGGDTSGVRLTELCDMLQLKQPAVTELVNRAIDAGLIQRRPAPDDRRGRLLTLTPEGAQRLRRVFDAFHDDRASLTQRFEELDIRFHAATL